MEFDRDELRFSAAVLAGGRSSRMRVDKAFLRLGNDLLIERQLRCLREAGAAELLISGRNEVDYSRFAANVVRDELQDAGPLAGVAAALKASTSELLIVLAIDMPRMNPAMIATILSQCKRAVGCVPFDESRFQALAAAYPVRLLPLAEHLLRIGRYSMQEFAEQAINAGSLRPLKIEPDERACFTNMNFPSEWDAFKVQMSCS